MLESHVLATGKDQAAICKSVDCRCLYNLVPGASQRVVALIICKKEKDVGPRLISVA